MNTVLLKRCASAFCACSLLFAPSCKDDDDKMTYEFDDEKEIETPVPTTDALTEKLDLPAVVLGNTFSKIGNAFVNRLTNRQSDFDENTMVVVFDANTFYADTFETLVVKAFEVYDRGGVLVLEATDDEALNANNAELVLLTNHNDQCFVQNGSQMNSMRVDVDKTDSTKTIATENTPDELNITPYQYGLCADLMTRWVEKNCKPTPVLKSASTRASNDVQFDKQTFSTIYFVYNDETKARNLQVPYQITYEIQAFYSFDKDEDYYVVHEEMIGANQGIAGNEWESDGWECEGFYLGEVESEHWLETSNGTKLMMNQAILHDPKPNGTESNTSYTSGVSVNIGGNVGVSSSGASGGLSSGVSINESSSVSIPDVKVINLSFSPSGIYGSNGGISNAFWRYDVKDPKAYDKGFKIKTETPPNVSTSTIILHNYWYWTVPNPKQYGDLYLHARNSILFSHLKVDNKFFTYYWKNPCSGLRYRELIRINPPARSK